MTVAELIEKLKLMPQDYKVGIFVDEGLSQATEVYETVSAVYIGDRVGPSKSSVGLMLEDEDK